MRAGAGRRGSGAPRTRGSRAERSPGGSRGRRRPVPPRAPPPPAGRARRSAGRRPGACRVVPSRAARPRGESPSGARAQLPPLDRSHFSCTTLRGGRGGAAGRWAGRYVLPGQREPGGRGRGDAAPRAAGGGCRCCLDGRPRPGSAPQPSGETAGKRELLEKRSSREKRNINWAVSKGASWGSGAVSCLKLCLLLRARGTAAVLL